MMVRGPVRKGEALLVGYNGAKGDVGRYTCDATRSNPDGDPCISFGALRVDEAVGVEIVRLLQPLGVEAAIQAIAQREHQSGEKQRQIELALEQARYEATRSTPRIVWLLTNSSGGGMALRRGRADSITRLAVRKNRRGQTRWTVEPETVELIRACARMMPDKAIAGMLNRAGKRTGRSNGWTQSRVRGFRNTHDIAVYRDGEWAERGEVTLTEAARMLNLSPATVLRQIRAGIIPAEQYCKGSSWVIKRRNIEDSMIAALPMQQQMNLVTLDVCHDLAQHDPHDTLTRDGSGRRMMPGGLHQFGPHLQQALALLGAQSGRSLSEQDLQFFLECLYGRI
ncbi:helix-turn-helix domain-containing protein [Mesorhizobium sophorae]|uniref:helix-turn-helix domain-containing protein n=1 Tax=Mesorhizobium sophorae TaxID=1300294 RepID=UPI00315B14FD